MNTVKKCSISGIAFTLADDAFEVLDAYLKRLRTQYAGHKDGDEIVADIEARIAELILSAQDGTRTVELPLIRNIIAQMGSPEQIGEEGAEGPKPAAPRIPRRLYRDPENAKLGGVCAGLGKYFDVDSVWIRLAFFSPLLAMVLFNWIPLSHFFDRLAGNLMGFFVLGYLIMWFVVPTARTARQKLEMKGERITSAAIGSATAAAGGVDGDSKTVVASTVSAFGTVLLILLKLFAGLIVFTLMVAACGLIVALFNLGVVVPHLSDLSGFHVVDLTATFGLLIVLIPCLLMIYVLMCLIASRRPSGRWTLATFLLWIVTIIALIASAVRDCNSDEADEWSRPLPAPTHDSRNLLSDVPAESEADGEEELVFEDRI
ncbi:PspC domain-containing protein [uncultured Alistipes sp.]|uniref:PspC domain-containing protein n=1 Tax=uncultured Alistipes sp. TaxID=538949 RepID=UPI0032B2A786